MIKLVKPNVASNKLLKFVTLAAIGVNLNANPTLERLDFATNLTFPDITAGKVFAPTNNVSHRTLFYTGTKDGYPTSGYFLAKNFLGWSQHSYPVLDAYNTRNKYIIDVANGPSNKTVVLSYAEGTGQLISYSADGRGWSTVKITQKDVSYDHLVKTNAAGLTSIMSYGNNHDYLLTSLDLSYWQQWRLPNPCERQSSCIYDNKFFGSIDDKYAVVQNVSNNGVTTNYLSSTTNLVDWYRRELPFANQIVDKVIGRDDLVFAATHSSAGNKLWWSPDLTNWGSYAISGQVVDAKSYRNKIMALVVKETAVSKLHSVHGDDPECPIPDCPAPPECPSHECPPCPCQEHHKTTPTEPDEIRVSTNVIVIDTETNTHEVVHTFAGRVTSLTSYDDKLFIAGDFTNDADNKHAILASTNL